MYLISIILQAPSSLTQCSSGYLSTEGCDLSTLEDHIFSGAETTISSFGGEDYDPVPLNSDGYAIQNYLVPTSDRSSVAFFGKSPNYDFRDCCLPVHEQRNNIVWNSFLANEDLLDYSASTGLEIDVRNIPAVASGTEAGANDFQIANQNNVQKSLISSEGTCPYDNSATPLKNYTYQQNLQNFSSLFSDAALSCPSCVAQAATASGSVFFNGTLWVSKSDDNGCASFYCTIYPFAFLDFLASVNSTADFILSTFGCEQGLGAFRKDPSYEGKNQTILSMTYMNLLTNMLISPSLNTYEAQGSFSQYGYLDFNPNAISQFQAFLLTLFAMMLLNGFWPIAVWRLAHERGNALVGMMQTVGLGPITYLCGMYLFDMMIAVFAGILMVIFAVYLNLSRFKDAPVGLLIAVVLCSAHALTAMSLLLTKVADSQASLLSLVAACMVVGMAVCTALVCIIVYPNDGEWPNAMSILPFFAQGRALYIILVYHRTSSEVDAALGLLFAFGVFCFGCCCALEKQHELLNLWDSIFFNYENAPKVLVSGAALDGGSEYEDQNQSLTGSRQLSDIESANTTSNRLVDLVDQLHDEDLAMEKNKAMAYAPSTNANYAIFTQELTHYFPPKKSMNFFSMFSGESTASSSGHYAVKGVSMALSLGECFGLLGPNGAGNCRKIS